VDPAVRARLRGSALILFALLLVVAWRLWRLG
jgi:hypothetical protein